MFDHAKNVIRMKTKGKQNCILKKIIPIVVQTHVFITTTKRFLTKKTRLIMPNTLFIGNKWRSKSQNSYSDLHWKTRFSLIKMRPCINNKNSSNDNINNNNNSGSNINNFVQPVNCVSESYKSFSAGSQSVNILPQLKPICQW